MKRNVILSTVAATVVTGVLMMSGCTSSSPKQADQSYTAEGTVSVVVGASGSVDSTVSTEDGKVNASATITNVSACVDANDDPKPCEDVCTTANPCSVTIEAACGPDAKLNYANVTDYVGAFAAWNAATDTVVTDVKNDTNTITTFSGSTQVTQTGGITVCDFELSTFIVCALTENNQYHYYNTSTNSAGYVIVLVEYADGTKEWKKVNIERKSNGEENDQPFINITDITGKVPVKFSVFSILNVGAPATGSTGSTGTIGAAD